MPRKKSRRAKRGIFTSNKTGRTCKFRSSWEEKYLKHLDDDPSVEDFVYEPFFITYISNQRTGKRRKYYPDIVVRYCDGSCELVEIKPARKVHKVLNRKKLAAASIWCMNNNVRLNVVTEVQLKALGLI